MKNIVVAAFYKFSTIDDPEAFQLQLKRLCLKQDIHGILLVAAEGINGTISGSRDAIDVFQNFIQKDGRFSGWEYKESFADKHPFLRLRVRLKREIVTLRQPQADPSKQVGTYVDPEQWNDIISDPDVRVIDTRNDFEVKMGTFERAENPATATFGEFPEYVKQIDPKKQKKVAMFCTGGIRCEKASSYMVEQGFEEVYHLKGGILKYLETVKKEDSKWSGECFVFDQRVSVDHDLNTGTHTTCYGCRMPLSIQDRDHDSYEPGISCPHCFDKKSQAQRARAESRQKQVALAKKRNTIHIGR